MQRSVLSSVFFCYWSLQRESSFLLIIYGGIINIILINLSFLPPSSPPFPSPPLPATLSFLLLLNTLIYGQCLWLDEWGRIRSGGSTFCMGKPLGSPSSRDTSGRDAEEEARKAEGRGGSCRGSFSTTNRSDIQIECGSAQFRVPLAYFSWDVRLSVPAKSQPLLLCDGLQLLVLQGTSVLQTLLEELLLFQLPLILWFLLPFPNSENSQKDTVYLISESWGTDISLMADEFCLT